NEGDSWLRQRRLIQPAFSKQRIESYAPAMIECTQRMLSQWQDGDEIDIARALMELTMAIAGKTLLGIDVGERFGEVTRHLQVVLFDFLARFGAALPLPYWMPTIRNLRLKHAIGKLDRILQGLIDQRRVAGASGGDFLSLLLNAKDEVDGRGISDRQIRD